MTGYWGTYDVTDSMRAIGADPKNFTITDTGKKNFSLAAMEVDKLSIILKQITIEYKISNILTRHLSSVILIHEAIKCLTMYLFTIVRWVSGLEVVLIKILEKPSHIITIRDHACREFDMEQGGVIYWSELYPDYGKIDGSDDRNVIILPEQKLDLMRLIFYPLGYELNIDISTWEEYDVKATELPILISILERANPEGKILTDWVRKTTTFVKNAYHLNKNLSIAL